jgi:hypothetical protein
VQQAKLHTLQRQASALMPNAATHLVAAWNLLEREPLRESAAEPDARAAFLLGAISPDVKAISGATREATHFYTIPPDGVSAPCAMMAAHASLAHSRALAPTHAAFVAGYLSHLVMDEVWLQEIVMPYIYVDRAGWGPSHPRFRLYSYLMVYLERRGVAVLDSEAPRLLLQAEPDGWLPFVAERFLRAWRDQVAEQITVGGAALVTRYFAEMSGMTMEEMAAITSSEARMAEVVYPIVPRACIEAFQRRTFERNLEVIGGYL